MDALHKGEAMKRIVVLGVCAATALSAQTFTTLFRFDGADGRQPVAALVQGVDGNLYGTAPYAGVNGYGTVFKMTPSGALTTPYSFCSQSGCADGEFPYSALVQADGGFYGTTVNGGDTGNSGTAFKITPNGTLTMLDSFCAQGFYPCPDGSYPYAGLVQATNGDFYGTTRAGGQAY